MRPMSVDEAVRSFRQDPAKAQLVRDAYLGADVLEAAERFAASSEFRATLEALGAVKGWRVLDVGAGNGIASYAFAKAGAKVTALEPDASDLVGRGAMAALLKAQPFEVSDALGERMPFDDASFDLVYGRQVLHHIPPLDKALKEMARVLRPGGLFLAVREHVYTSPADLEAFLASHPTHQLAGNEGAHRLEAYRGAIRGAGLKMQTEWGPMQGLINAFPLVQDEAGLRAFPLRHLKRLGPWAAGLGRVPGVGAALGALDRWKQGRVPGRLYSFLARKPS